MPGTELAGQASRAVSRLEQRVRSDGDLRLIPYLMAGYPDREGSIRHGLAFARAGVAAIEVGIPHSDPLADGPVVQRAGQVALEGGMTVRGALEVAGAIAEAGVPVVLMTSVNPVLAHDERRFAAEASAAGVAGVIVPDLPAQESAPLARSRRPARPGTGFLGAATPPGSRLPRIPPASSRFRYS